MNRYLLALTILICGIFVGLFAYQTGLSKGITQGTNTEKYKEEAEVKDFSGDSLWQLINNYKKSNNLPELKIDQRFCTLAKTRAEQSHNQWSHDTWWADQSLIFQQICPECRHDGENLARGYTTPQDIMSAWLKSPGHKANLDYPFTIGCLGTDYEGGNFYVALELALN